MPMKDENIEADLRRENERLRKTVETALAWLEDGIRNYDDSLSLFWYRWFRRAIEAVKNARDAESCRHERLDIDGCCWNCGADCRGIPTK
jgi:hypothetical protein